MSDLGDSGRDDLWGRLFRWYWRRRASRARDPSALRRRVIARKAELDRIAQEIEGSIQRKRIAAGVETAAAGEGAAVWRFTPDLFTQPLSPNAWRDPPSDLRIGRAVTLFHECESGAFSLVQRPNRAAPPPQRFELYFESYEFAGAYFSLAIGPPAHLRRPSGDETLRVEIASRASRPLKAFFRLNISGARGRDTLHAEGEVGAGPLKLDFDLGFAAFQLHEGDDVWFDLIVDRPRMAELSLQDVTMTLLRAGGGR